jgi:hypothetical protein
MKQTDFGVQNSFYKLREEALKSWEYSFSDEVMKFLNYRNLESRRDCVPSQDQIESRIRGRWWEVVLYDRNGNFYCCIIEPFLTHTSLHLKFGKPSIQCNDSMFIAIGQAVQNPESMLFGSIPIRCIIRLKVLNNLSGIIRDLCQESLHFFRTVPTCTMQEYREFDISLPSLSSHGNILINSRQLPSPSDVATNIRLRGFPLLSFIAFLLVIFIRW